VRLHLLDGTFELFRSHFGAPPRKDREGNDIGAVHGLISSTLSLLQEPGVTHIAAAFDTVIRSFRNEMYLGYKTEVGAPEELLAQFDLAERAMAALGVTVWSMVEY
jgi:5'-3' exonuclease